MKRPFPTENKDRFSGQLRHYHRSGAQNRRTWDEWVDGKSARTSVKSWWKVIVLLIALLALGGIIVGLFIELR
jgi:hypothetical protein